MNLVTLSNTQEGASKELARLPFWLTVVVPSPRYIFVGPPTPKEVFIIVLPRSLTREVSFNKSGRVEAIMKQAIRLRCHLPSQDPEAEG